MISPPDMPVAGVDGQVLRGSSRLVAWANFVKIAHTVFALPFAVVGMVTASKAFPLTTRSVLLAALAFTAARFAAMGFNRIVDLRYDALNPRTSSRELPAGRMTLREAWVLVGVACVIFVAAAGLLNRLCLVLAPLALGWVLAYSYSKRFTSLSHLWLGIGMAIAPAGGYLAIAGSWSTPWWIIPLLSLAVSCWGAGFDVLYSLQDEAFDRSLGLKSITVALGARNSIAVARALHFLAAVSLLGFGIGARFGAMFMAFAGLAVGLLAWEHRLVSCGDYSKLDTAFFTMNGIISGLVMIGAVLDAAL